MKFVILSSSCIPGFNGARGPILTPTAYDLHLVLQWLCAGVDVREVMPDGSYRKLQFNDEKIMKEIDEELEMKRIQKEQNVDFLKEEPVKKVDKPKVIKTKPVVKQETTKVVEEPKKEEKPSFVVDDLEKLE